MFSQASPQAQSTANRKLHVLLVEDEPVQLEIYRQKLASWDIPMEVTSADNGINALLKLGQTPPDIVITDLNMPLMDGFQMLRMMFQSIRSQNSTFVVITGIPLDEVRQQGTLPIEVPLMSKPVDYEKLEKIVREKVDELSL